MKTIKINLVRLQRKKFGHWAYQVRIILDFTGLSPQEMEDLTTLLCDLGFEVIKNYGGRDDPEYESGDSLIMEFVSIFSGIHGANDSEDSPSLGQRKNRTLKEAFLVICEALSTLKYQILVLKSALSTLSDIEGECKSKGVEDPSLFYPELADYSNLIENLKRYTRIYEEKHRERTPKLDSKPRVESKAMDPKKEENLTMDCLLRDNWVCKDPGCSQDATISKTAGDTCSTCGSYWCPQCGSSQEAGTYHSSKNKHKRISGGDYRF